MKYNEEEITEIKNKFLKELFREEVEKCEHKKEFKKDNG